METVEQDKSACGKAALHGSPMYAAAFRCIGPECEDTCCGDWDIPVDRRTYGSYQQLPPGELRSLVSQFVVIRTDTARDDLYARIQRDSSETCAFFGADRLCAMQKEHGAGYLPQTCAIYPRALARVAGTLEGSLSLSCPEAARNVLLGQDFMEKTGILEAGELRPDSSFVFNLACDRNGFLHKPESAYAAIRTLMIHTIRDRSQPLCQRLLAIGWLCRRMDEAAATGGLLEVLSDFQQRVGDQRFWMELDSLPVQPRLRLQVLFELTSARAREGVGRRFQDVFWALVECVGGLEDGKAGSDVERLRKAEEVYYHPFLRICPYILENYLINYMFKNLFPYGRERSANCFSHTMFEEYVQMTAQFAWMNVLLAGVAGVQQDKFSGAHVVEAVQSFTRALEHHPDVLHSMCDYLQELGIDTLQGMAILLRG